MGPKDVFFLTDKTSIIGRVSEESPQRDKNHCTASPARPLRSLDVVTGESHVVRLGEVVRLPRLLPRGLLQWVVQLVPAGESSQQSIGPVNLPVTSREIEIISLQINF